MNVVFQGIERSADAIYNTKQSITRGAFDGPESYTAVGNLAELGYGSPRSWTSSSGPRAALTPRSTTTTTDATRSGLSNSPAATPTRFATQSTTLPGASTLPTTTSATSAAGAWRTDRHERLRAVEDRNDPVSLHDILAPQVYTVRQVPAALH